MNSSHRRSSCSSSRSISPASFFLCRSERVDLAQVRRRCSRLMTSSKLVGGLVDDLLDGRAVGQFGGFLGPVLGEQR